MVYRCDRSSLNSDCSKGGGALIAARCNTFKKCERIYIAEIDHLEIVIIRLELFATRLFVIYIPSGSKGSVYDS